MNRSRQLLSQRLVGCLAIAGLVLATTGPAVGQSAPNWLPSVSAALEAAARSGKLVYVFVYRPGLPKALHMGSGTLTDPNVLRALRNYEACPVDVYNPQNEQVLRERKMLQAGEEEAGATKVAELPISLFLNKQGQEICRLHGYLPPRWFIKALATVRAIATAQTTVQVNPEDAVTHARLGHLYMELLAYDQRLRDKARESLNRAVALDPRNQTGAKAEAGLDLLVMAIPDDPQQVANDLRRYPQTYPRSPRRLEAQYYMAVAYVAAGNTQEAIKVLRTFEAFGVKAPEYTSPWTEHAVALLTRLRQPGG